MIGHFPKILSEDFDLIHVHSHLHFSSNLAVLANVFKGLPMALTSHGVVDLNGFGGVVNYVYGKTVAKWMLKSVDGVIALTEKHAENLEFLGADANCITVIPNGIDLSKIHTGVDKSCLRERYGKRNLILFVGSLIPRKGINYLIDSMKYVSCNAILLVVGGELQSHPGYSDYLKKQVSSLGLNNVNFLGRVSKEELECLYNVADIFVLPSLSEGLPLTLIEAMAYGKCVITTDIIGNSEVIIHNYNGLLCRPKDAVNLANCINYAMKNPDVSVMLGVNARQDIERKYRLENMIKKTIDLYKSLV